MARPRSRSRGTKEWIGSHFPLVTLTVTQAALLTFTHDLTETILRIRGNIHISGVPDAALESDQVGLGMIIASDPAVAAGGAALPGPIADPDAPWIWHQYVPLFGLSSTAASDTAIGLQRLIEIDSKAMRKVDRNETLVLMGELASGGLVTVRAHGGMRVLTLLG